MATISENLSFVSLEYADSSVCKNAFDMTSRQSLSLVWFWEDGLNQSKKDICSIYCIQAGTANSIEEEALLGKRRWLGVTASALANIF